MARQSIEQWTKFSKPNTIWTFSYGITDVCQTNPAFSYRLCKSTKLFLYAYKTFVRVRNLLYVYKIFYTHTKPFVCIRNLLYAYETFCMRTKPFVCIRNRLYAYKSIVYAYKRFRMHKKPFVCLRNLLYAYKIFCKRKNIVYAYKTFCTRTKLFCMHTKPSRHGEDLSQYGGKFSPR